MIDIRSKSTTTAGTLAVVGLAMFAVAACSGGEQSSDAQNETSVEVVEPNSTETESAETTETSETTETDKSELDDSEAEPEKQFVEHVPIGPVKQDPVLTPPEQARETDEDSKSPPPPINPFIRTADDPQSTFAVDVDTGSYTASRKRIRHGSQPDPKHVRVEEFVNYFTYGYPSPESGPFGVSVDGAPSLFSGEVESDETERRHLLRVGVQGKRIDDVVRKPLNLVFLVDVSGSMNADDRLPLAKKSLKILARNLEQGDSVSIATYASGVQTILEPTDAGDQSTIVEAVENLDAGGSTAMDSGLQTAYDLADENFSEDAVNRVVVVTDGNANVGATSHDEILEKVESHVERGVTLSTVGFGMNYNDGLLEQLANNGNGNYFYVDTADEARRIFGDELESTMQVIAKDVKIQVEFDEHAVEQYRLVGYENRDIADEDFRDDTVDAGEIGAGHNVTAYYELFLAPDAPERLGTVRIRHKTPEADKSDPATEQRFHITEADLRESFESASKSFRFGAAVTATAEKLRVSPFAEGLTWERIRSVADDAVGQSRRKRDFVELVDRLEDG